MKQFQVPQFIDVEDKILGFITMRQFFIMLIPIGAGILFYFILDLWLAIIMFIPIAVIASLFAFVRPNGMRFSRFLGSFLSFTFKPRLYVWKRQENTKTIEISNSYDNIKTKQSKGLKEKKGNLETGSKVDESNIQSIGRNDSDFLNDILND